MSCTHDCGCSPETRDARTDEWVQIAPESARPATLTPERPVKAPGQGGDIFLTRGTPVEAVWPSGNYSLYWHRLHGRGRAYVDEGGYQLIAGHVGVRTPLPWDDGRIVRVLTGDKPAPEPVLPRQIKPEDVRVGMLVERRKGESHVGGRVKHINDSGIGLDGGAVAWVFGGMFGDRGWSLWLVEDEPVDPDAAVIEAIITAYRRSPECSTDSVFGEAMLDHLRAQGFDVTRAEQ